MSCHRQHSRNPVTLLAVAICSRRRIECAVVPVINELAADEVTAESLLRSNI